MSTTQLCLSWALLPQIDLTYSTWLLPISIGFQVGWAAHCLRWLWWNSCVVFGLRAVLLQPVQLPHQALPGCKHGRSSPSFQPPNTPRCPTWSGRGRALWIWWQEPSLRWSWRWASTPGALLVGLGVAAPMLAPVASWPAVRGMPPLQPSWCIRCASPDARTHTYGPIHTAAQLLRVQCGADVGGAGRADGGALLRAARLLPARPAQHRGLADAGEAADVLHVPTGGRQPEAAYLG